MDVYFTTLGDAGKRYYGKLRQIHPTPDEVNNVVLYDALFDVDNRDGRLMTQMTAQVFFVVPRRRTRCWSPSPRCARPTLPPASARRGARTGDPVAAGDPRTSLANGPAVVRVVGPTARSTTAA